VPFNHNDHYHPLLLRQVPADARLALDVGCGTGKFARRLAATGLEVEGVDPAPEVIEAAKDIAVRGPGTVRYRQEDVTVADLPEGRYDFISCVASLHHFPFDTVSSLRGALAPGGVLAVLGLAKPRSALDLTKWVVLGPPVNLVARGAVATGEWLSGGAESFVRPPVLDAAMTMTEIRRRSATLLPGRSVRPLLFWRYLLTYQRLVDA
jgi:SAM-dependent methyltransferase